MRVTPQAWVFDTGPLRHFAEAGWLGPLRFLIPSGATALIPQSVESELHEASEYSPALRQVLEDSWLGVYRDESLDFLMAYSAYAKSLVEGKSNRGECGVLAMGEIFGCTVVLDDETPRLLAEEKGMKVVSTVQLLVDAVRKKQLTLESVEALADDLLATKYYLPFESGGFRKYVLENGLLDYDWISPEL